MNVREGDKVEMIYHMSNRGIVKKIYYIKPTVEAIGGTFQKKMRIIFESELDGQIYDIAARDLRVVRE